MKTSMTLVVSFCICLLTACSPVNLPVKNNYQLTRYSVKQYPKASRKLSILVSLPLAVAAYDTEQMFYVKKPFELAPFAYNAWASPPANMLYPLLIQSLQRSGYFYAVVSSPFAEEVNYRLDTQLLKLHQNFICKPSQIELTVKVVLTRTSDNRVIASRIIHKQVPSPCNSPYGGVLAANKATELLTAEVTDFVIYYVGGSK